MGVPFGELSTTAARSVLRRYSDAWFEAAARVGQGRPAGFPRRKRGLMPLRWYAGTFTLAERRLRLSVAAGRPPLVVRLARAIPYPAAQVRSVTLVVDGGRLAVDVTAEVPVPTHDLDPDRVAGVDMGVIHPYAVVCGPDALLVSGRAARAEQLPLSPLCAHRASRPGRRRQQMDRRRSSPAAGRPRTKPPGSRSAKTASQPAQPAQDATPTREHRGSTNPTKQGKRWLTRH
jgi:putative transposase